MSIRRLCSAALACAAFSLLPCAAQEHSPDAKLTSADWTSIRAAYDAGRHRVFAVESGHRAHNPGQQWSTLFDGRGFTTTPDAGGWSWGLELVGYGWGEESHGVERPRGVTAEGRRVAYAWDEALTEWYANDRRGLEHGYTIQTRPEHASGSLALVLAIRGGLEPAVSGDGRDVRFVDAAGGDVLHYAGLEVFDADGARLEARWESSAGELRLSVDDRRARYPLTIDPIAQQAYLKASNTEARDFFGYSISVSGDTVVVGAPGEDSNATGVNGDQSNNLAVDSGAAYVFVRSGTSWSQQAYVKASNTGAGDVFGGAVAVSGDTVVVGAEREDSNATGVNGDQSNNSAADSGAAYVFVRNGTTWSQQAYLKASNTGAGDIFGSTSISVSGDTVVVGAWGEDSNATGVNGDQSNNSATTSGAAYVFVRNGTTWSQQAYLKASNTEALDLFGYSISVSGDTVVVGAYLEDSNATGVNGNQSDNSAAGSGAAYVFVRNGTTWSQQAYLKASNTGGNDLLGTSISVSGDTVVVGAYFEDSNATGVNGDQSNNLGFDSGAAYVFVRSGTSWSQQAYLKASNTGNGDEFAYSLSVSGDTAVVGAQGEDSNATGVNGNQSDNSAGSSGAAYVFVRNGTTWSQQAYLKASNTDINDRFTYSLSVSGDTVVVGAYTEDSNATGVNGDQSNNSASEAGAAYVFLLPTFGSFVPFGAGCIGSNALAPAHSASVDGGTPERGELIRYMATSAAPNAPAALFLGFSNTLWNGVPLPLNLGFIGADPSCSILVEGFVQLPFATDGTGRGFKDVPTANTVPIGTRLYTQTVHIDLGVPSPLKITVSNGLETVLGG
jgi:hypothetical protein